MATDRAKFRGVPMGRLMVFLVLAGAFLGLTSPSPALAAPEPTVTVVTQNLDIGADLSPILAAPDLQAAFAAAGQVFAAGSGEPSHGADGGGRR